MISVMKGERRLVQISLTMHERVVTPIGDDGMKE